MPFTFANLLRCSQRTAHHPPINLTPPVITGTPTQGQTLSATISTWTGASSITFQWYADGEGIDGATASTYFLTASEVDKAITRADTAHNTDGDTTVFSAPTAAVASNNPTTPTLAAITSPIGRATKVGAGSVPLDSDTLGLLVSSGTSAISSWQIRQTSGPAQWKDPAGDAIGSSFITATGSPVPSAALTAGATSTFEVKATNGSGTSPAGVFTYTVQSGVDARPGYNISSQAQLTAVCPTTGTLSNLNDAELWLPRGVKTWETAQLLIRRVRCAAGHTGYIRPADFDNPPWLQGGTAPGTLESVKAQGCTNIVFQGLRARKDSLNTYLYYAFPDGTTYSSQNVSFEDCSFGAITQTDANTALPSGFSINSTEGGHIDDCVGAWINGFATFSCTGSTFLRCGDYTIRRGFGRHFRNNGLFRGGTSSSHIIDNVNDEDMLFIAPTQQDPQLHMDGAQDTGTATAGTVSNCTSDRMAVLVGEGVGVVQGHFGRTDLGNTHTNIVVNNMLALITAVWGFAFGAGSGRTCRRSLFSFDPNAYDIDGVLRSNDYITMIASLATVGFVSTTASNPAWALVDIENNYIQRENTVLYPAGTTTLNNKPGGDAALDTLTSYFNDPAGFDKAGVGWAAFTTREEIIAEVIRCLKPVLNGPMKNGDGTYAGPLFPDGSWNDGTVYS